jgi:hypothetical protein
MSDLIRIADEAIAERDCLRAEIGRYRACLLHVRKELEEEFCPSPALKAWEWQKDTLMAVREALESTNEKGR